MCCVACSRACVFACPDTHWQHWYGAVQRLDGFLQSTIAFSGGARERPMISVTRPTRSRLVENLNVSKFPWLDPVLPSRLAIVAFPTLGYEASSLGGQCVTPSFLGDGAATMSTCSSHRPPTPLPTTTNHAIRHHHPRKTAIPEPENSPPLTPSTTQPLKNQQHATLGLRHPCPRRHRGRAQALFSLPIASVNPC